MGLIVLLFIGAVLALASTVDAQTANVVLIEGAVTRGSPFARQFGPGFTLAVKGQSGFWGIEITHAASPERDLIYPVNPPYRFSNRQYIGPGYGESARESASNTPRDFLFVARPDDVERAWNDVERLLWPYTHNEPEVQRAADELAHLQTGTLRFEILGADFASCGDRGRELEECVSGLKFRATVTWPATP